MSLSRFRLAYFGATGPVLRTSVRAPRDLVPLAVAETVMELRELAENAGFESGSPEHIVYQHFLSEQVTFTAAVPVNDASERAYSSVAPGLPAGHAGTALHQGAHEAVLDELLELRTWILEQGLTPVGSPCEFHWFRPEDGYDSGSWETELVWFVAEDLPVPDAATSSIPDGADEHGDHQRGISKSERAADALLLDD